MLEVAVGLRVEAVERVPQAVAVIAHDRDDADQSRFGWMFRGGMPWAGEWVHGNVRRRAMTEQAELSIVLTTILP